MGPPWKKRRENLAAAGAAPRVSILGILAARCLDNALFSQLLAFASRPGVPCGVLQIRALPLRWHPHRASDGVLCAVKLATLYGEGTIAGNLRHARVRMLCLISGQSLTWTPAGVKSGLAEYAGSTAREHRRYHGLRSLVWGDQGL